MSEIFYLVCVRASSILKFVKAVYSFYGCITVNSVDLLRSIDISWQLMDIGCVFSTFWLD